MTQDLTQKDLQVLDDLLLAQPDRKEAELSYNSYTRVVTWLKKTTYVQPKQKEFRYKGVLLKRAKRKKRYKKRPQEALL